MPADRVKILLVDDDPGRARDLAAALAADPELQVVRIEPGVLAADAVAAHAPDVVIVDMARPDRDALDGVRQIAARDPRPVVLFVDDDDPAFMEEAIRAGVLSYNVTDTSPRDAKPILRAAVALFAQHQRTSAALRASELNMRERQSIDRAKAVLIRDRRLSEGDAHRWLQRQAMRRRLRIAEVARDLLREAGQDTP